VILVVGCDQKVILTHGLERFTSLLCRHSFVSAASVDARNALSGAARGAATTAVGQDAQLVAAHNKGFVRAASVNARNALRLGGRLRCSNECCWTRQSFDP